MLVGQGQVRSLLGQRLEHSADHIYRQEFIASGSLQVLHLGLIAPSTSNLFQRTVELRGGKIEIDGQNISNMGLSVLRRKLALVPQDSTMFLGTLRENLYVLFPSIAHETHAQYQRSRSFSDRCRTHIRSSKSLATSPKQPQ